MGRLAFVGVLAATLLAPRLAAAQLQVTGTSPARHAIAAANTDVAITFDRAIDPATVNAASFRVFGRVSGPRFGTFTLSNGNRTVTLDVGAPFAAGETVLVNLSHDLRGADATALRAAGHAFAFRVATAHASLVFHPIATLDARDGGPQTTIYGTMAADLDDDGWPDLTTVNESSADLRVFMNRADGSGLFDPFLTPPVAAGAAASPHTSVDFDNDGRIDACVAAPATGKVFVFLGNGDGTFTAAQQLAGGLEPRGVAVLDADGDGDLDIANVDHQGGIGLRLHLNDGTGHFASPALSTLGFSAAYALGAADMNNDDITDLVVGGRDSQRVVVMLGNGNGTFTAGPIVNGGGWVWHLNLGDVDADGNLDVATANSVDANGAILRGNGDGTLAGAEIKPMPGFVVSTVLGDLDGDGDLDWILSGGSNPIFRLFLNNGSGTFTAQQDIATPGISSCATLADLDNDGDLDMALSDELVDVVSLMLNGSLSPLPCPASPPICREPIVGGKASLKVKRSGNSARNQILWKWLKGAATDAAELGTPTVDDHYTLCIYDGGALVSTATAEAGGTCGGSACWRALSSGFAFKDRDGGEFGVDRLQVRAGADQRAKMLFRGRGLRLETPDLAASGGPIDVRLITSAGPACWGATYSAPFVRNDASGFQDRAD